MKLKDVYITYNGKKVRVVPKSKGVPKGDSGPTQDYYDPSEWKMSSAHFFLEQFTALTYGGCDPKQIQHEFEKIDEYNELEERALGKYKPKCAA